MNAFGYDVAPQEQQDFVLSPEEVIVKIEVAEMKDAKKQGNRFLYVESVLLEGAQAGRKAIMRFNLINDNPQAVEIARRDFDALCFALGFEPGNAPQKPEDLIGGDYLLNIRVKQRKDTGANENAWGFKRKGSTFASQATPAQVGTAQQAANANSSGGAPWKRAANG